MARSRSNGKKKNIGGIIDRLLSGKNKKSYDTDEFEEVFDHNDVVPEDVKEGHFAVFAVDDEECKRFVVPLSYLTNPSFLRLLEQAAEEYGFNHDGALTIPCRPSKLERMLAEEMGGGGGSRRKWSSRSEMTMVKSW